MTGELASQIALAMLVSTLVLALYHWFPWSLALRRQLHRITAYILGVSAIVVPLSVLEWVWAIDPPIWPWAHLAALLAVTMSGGLAVISAYALDALLARLARAGELQDILDQRDERRSGKS